jgi:hypothetical protein
MAIHRGYAAPDDPIYSEPLRRHSPYWARALLKSRKASTTPSDERPTERNGSETTPAPDNTEER